MAEKADDLTITFWLLLRDVHALVVKHGKPPLEAASLVIEYAQNDHFTECRWDGDRLIPLRHWGAWHPEIGLHIPVNFINSTVSYIRGEPAYTHGEPTLETDKLSLEGLKQTMKTVEEHLEKFFRWEKQEFKPRQFRRKDGSSVVLAGPEEALLPPEFQMRRVCLAAHEVYSMLRKAGLLGPSEQPPALEPSPPPTPQQVAAKPEPPPSSGKSVPPKSSIPPKPSGKPTIADALPWLEAAYSREKWKWEPTDETYDDFLCRKANGEWGVHWKPTSLQTTRWQLKNRGA
jgi:hypothetical protein